MTIHDRTRLTAGLRIVKGGACPSDYFLEMNSKKYLLPLKFDYRLVSKTSEWEFLFSPDDFLINGLS
jgi:hypothetical protein